MKSLNFPFAFIGQTSLALVLVACSTTMPTTYSDSEVKVVTSLDRTKCSDMGTAIGESELVVNEREAAEQAMEQARTRAGVLGGNRLVQYGAISFARKAEGKVIATATGQAWRCAE
jgi:hypothetical protein